MLGQRRTRCIIQSFKVGTVDSISSLKDEKYWYFRKIDIFQNQYLIKLKIATSYVIDFSGIIFGLELRNVYVPNQQVND